MADVLDRGEICSGYMGHVGSTKDGQGNIFAAFTVSVNAQPALLIRRRQHGTGAWSDVHLFDTGVSGDAKFGHCALECVGQHLVILASRRDPATGVVCGREYLILNVCEL